MNLIGVNSKRETAAFVLETPSDEDAAARCRMYALLAEAFAYPCGSAMLRLLGGELCQELRKVAAGLPRPVTVPTCLAVAGGDDAHDETQITYTDLFEAGAGRPAVSLLERRYSEGLEPEQKLWEDLLRYYTFFGLDFSKSGVRENPDHLLVELEFMHYLSFLEAGVERGRNDLRRGQFDFLSQHLGKWTAPLAAALAKENDTGPYGEFVAVLDDFVKTEVKYLEVLLDEPHTGG